MRLTSNISCLLPVYFDRQIGRFCFHRFLHRFKASLPAPDILRQWLVCLKIKLTITTPRDIGLVDNAYLRSHGNLWEES